MLRFHFWKHHSMCELGPDVESPRQTCAYERTPIFWYFSVVEGTALQVHDLP